MSLQQQHAATEVLSHIDNYFTLPEVNGSGQVILALQQFGGSLTELQHIFEYSLFNYTNFFNIGKQYDYTCSYSEL
jgi:hypothetical protein